MINRTSKWLFLLIAGLMMLPALTTAMQVVPDTLLIQDDGDYAFNKHLYYYQSPVKLDPESIYQMAGKGAFSRLYPKTAINAGVTNNYCYLLFTLHNKLPRDEIFFFQLHQPWLNLVQLYGKTDTGFVRLGQSGMKLKFNERPYKYYDMLFPLALRSDSSCTFIAVVDNKGASLNLLPSLVDNQTFKASERREYLLFGILTGIMVFSLVINIFLYVSLKERIHLLYFLYVLSMLYWLYCNTALDFQFFYPDHPFIAVISEYFAAAAGFVTMANLICGFLGVTRKNSRFKLAIDVLKYLFVVLPAGGFVIYKWYSGLTWLTEGYMYVFIGAAILLSVLFYLTAIEKILQKVSLGWFYLIGGCYIGFGIINYCIYLLGGSVNNSVQTVPNEMHIGLIVEAIIIFIGIIYRYNQYKNDREQLLVKLNRQQKETMQQIISAQENERKRIAQDIHDDLGATLGTLLLHISNIPHTDAQRNTYETAYSQASVDIARKAISDLRNIAYDLLPKDFTELGIFQVLKNRVDELNVISNIRFTLITDGNDKIIENIFSITLYRIVNELVNNILKHSQASMATIQLLVTDIEIMIILEDNGIGISNGPDTKGIGMKNIHSRVGFLHGKINIDASDKGTSVIIEIPFGHNANQIKDED